MASCAATKPGRSCHDFARSRLKPFLVNAAIRKWTDVPLKHGATCLPMRTGCPGVGAGGGRMRTTPGREIPMSAPASNRSRAMGLLPDSQPCRLVCRALNKPDDEPTLQTPWCALSYLRGSSRGARSRLDRAELEHCFRAGSASLSPKHGDGLIAAQGRGS